MERALVQGLLARARNLKTSVVNSAKLVSGNRFTAPYRSSYSVVIESPKFSLRHYGEAQAQAQTKTKTKTKTKAQGSCILMVPPLMVTAEIYDMSPELSAIAWLREQGHDVWGIDFGTPESTPEGLEKTLADHVLAVSDAIDAVLSRTGGPVHLVGYSQGGMFIYQTAALRRCEGIASIITMGSPVDLLRNLPIPVHTGVVANLLQSAMEVVRKPLAQLPKLPGQFTSLGFKLVSPRQELKHFLMMLRFLDDAEELRRIEPTRRFLGGEGFIAWPGPALRSFVDDIVVHNRLLAGGFVIAGKTVSLSDISVPILYFRGSRDDFARPGSVSAIERVVPHDDIFGLEIAAGHLGLVVGTRAREEVWPTVDAWLTWRDRGGPRPARIGQLLSQPQNPEAPAPASASSPSESESEFESESASLAPIAHFVKDALWRESGKVALDVTSGAHWLRWQLPRVLRLGQFWDTAQLSIARTLAEQAKAIPERTFFLWEGRAFSYAEANARVSHIAGALYHLGIRSGQTVGLLMDNHPDCLTALTALNRLGAIPALINPAARGSALEHALAVTGVHDLVLGPPSHALRETFGRRRLLIGSADLPHGKQADAIALDSVQAELPASVPANPGRAADIAFLMFTSGTTGKPKAVKISNRRWQMAATASAAGCDLAPSDTVYCCLPLHHATGLMLAAGGALLGGSRLAIAPRFSTRGFWEDIRRTGATVVFYVGELCRYLVAAPPSPLEKSHALRLFVGNGLRAEVWRELLHRFGRVSVLEFYASTEGNLVMSNLTGEKIGSVGRVPFGLVRTLVVQYDLEKETYPRDPKGHLIPAHTGEPGMLLVEIQSLNPMSRFDGYTDAAATEAKILRNVLRSGDAWFCSGDLMREDADGDYWFVDRVGDTFRWKGENVSTEQVAGVVAPLPFVEMCTIYGVQIPEQEGRAGMAAIKLRAGAAFDAQALFAAAEQHLIDAARPRFVRLVDELATTETMKLVKHPLQSAGIDLARTGPLYVYDRQQRTYSLVSTASELAACLPNL